MLVVIVYSRNFTSNAKSLSSAVKAEWDDVDINLMGVYGKTDSFSRYQVQLGRDMVYHSDSVTDNDTIINLIKERL
ncbi:MAG: hypothetical protein CBD58_02070 [bacterium TMED198]|nr:MAG: hypothetical protein CBD58_02070 [bacterium TMED198]|tara:strand:- start:83 stop:310 length:228 start_codon:yes stop_codon:yes gene_type:complete